MSSVRIAYTTSALNRLNQVFLRELYPQEMTYGKIDARVRTWFNPNLESRNFYVPAIVAILVMILSLLLTSMAIIREKETGTIEQLIVTPLKPIELIFGKTIPYILIAQAQMGASWRIGIDSEPTGLVARGLYRWVRHPIYTGLLAMLVGVVALTPSAWTLMGAGWIASMIALQARLEDTHLYRQHGASWLEWARRTGRLLPGFGTVRPTELA